MRHATPHLGVFYAWLVVATTFWMAMLLGGGHSGLGVLVTIMSEKPDWNRARRECLERS